MRDRNLRWPAARSTQLHTYAHTDKRVCENKGNPKIVPPNSRILFYSRDPNQVPLMSETPILQNLGRYHAVNPSQHVLSSNHEQASC